ncbi:MAG: AAA family ATPase, partial [Proteobacteria bacterium]|nr:AAA family ATPase [Pseudomonadota bacterium]
MRVKKLEVLGFKSFPERVSLSFPGGITGIVGPNGCGKSNLVDAVLWVVGERSAKHLRARLMEDVIFHGADGNKSMGMAEV